MLMPTVERYMTREPYSINSIDSLARAKHLMSAHLIRHLPVVEGERLVGVIADRDLRPIEAVPGIDLDGIAVARVMEPALRAWADEALDEVSVRMAEHKRDCVVVLGGHGIVGVFTATDALHALADIVRRATA
jgi:acetoin utilization protein AcuB